jgi:hypothetical protein
MKKIFRRIVLISISVFFLIFHQHPQVALADQASDLTALVNGITTVVLPSGNTPGTVTVHGRKAFPLIVETATLRPAIAAGYYNDDETKARALVYSHTGWASTSDARAQLLVNAVRWAKRLSLGLVPG